MAWNREVQVVQLCGAVEEIHKWGCLGVFGGDVGGLGWEAVSNTAATKMNPDVPYDWYEAALLNVLQTQFWQELCFFFPS